MEGIKANEVGNLLHSIAATGAIVNVSTNMATLSSDVVTRAVFGGKFTRRDDYLHELSSVNELMASASWTFSRPSGWYGCSAMVSGL